MLEIYMDLKEVSIPITTKFFMDGFKIFWWSIQR